MKARTYADERKPTSLASAQPKTPAHDIKDQADTVADMDRSTPRRNSAATPGLLTGPDVMRLQRQVGNQAILRRLSAVRSQNQSALKGGAPGAVVQRHLPGSLEALSESLITSTPVESGGGSTVTEESGGGGTTVSDESGGGSTPVEEATVETPTHTQTSVRGAVSTFDQTGGGIVGFVTNRIKDMESIPGLVHIVSKSQLIVDLAKDMAARGGVTEVTEEHTLSATNEVDVKGGGGFTALDGEIYILDTAKTSSALFHEVIHVLSGPGGATELAAIKMQLNEGFTNYFAEEVAKAVSGPIYTAYPFPTLWARNFVAKYGEDVAYDIYFKGNIAKLYDVMAAAYLLKLQGGVTELIKQPEINANKTRNELNLEAVRKTIVRKVSGADFVSGSDLANAWFTGRVF